MDSSLELTGRHAVVTGGASGIGFAAAKALLDKGANVTIVGRTASKLVQARELLANDRLETRTVDVSDEQQVVNLFHPEHGVEAPRIVVVSAGAGSKAVPFLESTTEDYRRILATNLDGAYWTIREGAKAMVREGKGGSIIAISSLAATQGAPYNQAYAASKAGVLAIANGAAVELARHGVRVNTLLPGWIATEMSAENQQSEVFTSRVISRVPMRRWGAPDEVAGPIAYLASDASQYQTGTTMVIDGGYRIF